MDFLFSMSDMSYVLRRTQTGRALGPDKLQMEILRLPPHPVKHIFFNRFNYCLLTGIAPAHIKFSKAIVIL